MTFKDPKTTSRIHMLLEPSLVGSPIWDICCDHGQLGIEALKRGQYGQVHFVDRVTSITEKLEKKLLYLVEKGLSSHFAIHCLEAQKLACSIEGTCIIAGVGGKTITTILRAWLEADLLKARRLVLSAHSDEVLMLSYFEVENFKKDYRIVDKKEVSDRLKIRSIYVLDRT
jgi:tRNA (adenine22-N1)-methyltransferase